MAPPPLPPKDLLRRRRQHLRAPYALQSHHDHGTAAPFRFIIRLLSPVHQAE